MPESKCRFCNEAIQGGAECVSCFRARLSRCPVCVNADGKLLAKYRKKISREGKMKQEWCGECRNDRWILQQRPPQKAATSCS
jgi:hypothetical protein